MKKKQGLTDLIWYILRCEDIGKVSCEYCCWKMLDSHNSLFRIYTSKYTNGWKCMKNICALRARSSPPPTEPWLEIKTSQASRPPFFPSQTPPLSSHFFCSWRDFLSRRMRAQTDQPCMHYGQITELRGVVQGATLLRVLFVAFCISVSFIPLVWSFSRISIRSST